MRDVRPWVSKATAKRPSSATVPETWIISGTGPAKNGPNERARVAEAPILPKSTRSRVVSPWPSSRSMTWLESSSTGMLIAGRLK